MEIIVIWYKNRVECLDWSAYENKSYFSDLGYKTSTDYSPNWLSLFNLIFKLNSIKLKDT